MVAKIGFAVTKVALRVENQVLREQIDKIFWI
jgi:hypothetical protein